jgi:CheY-like chemotaxis protein
MKVYLVDDNAMLARLIPTQMTKYGHEVLGVSADGEEALRRIPGLAVDLVLMDLDLEGVMDGVATALALQKERLVPIVFITSHAGPEIQARVKEVRFSLCLSKPFTEREIALTMSLCLERARHEQDRAWWQAELEQFKRGAAKAFPSNL